MSKSFNVSTSANNLPFIQPFNINNSVFKIYYYGNPKKLRTELSKFGYQLRNDQGFWQIYLNE